MSSDAFLSFDDGEEITLEQWQEFAAAHGLNYRPEVVGANTFQHEATRVQVQFGGYVDRGSCPDPEAPDPGPCGQPTTAGHLFGHCSCFGHAQPRIDFSLCKPPAAARQIIFTTTWNSPDCPEVARLAVAAWHRFGGSLAAAEEVRCYVQVSDLALIPRKDTP